MAPTWTLLHAAALAAALAHTFVDFHLGLYGPTSEKMSLLQATNVALTCLVVAGWVVCLVAALDSAPRALAGATAFAVVWTFLANGVGAVLAAPPPADAFPYQDLAHVLGAVIGGCAAVAGWREHRRACTPWSWAWSGGAIALLAALFVVQSVLSAPYV